MAVFALILAAALAASDPDGVVATAPATAVDLEATERPTAPSMQAAPHGLSTDEQIDRWLAARSTAEPSWEGAAAESTDDRGVHGEVSFGIGTGGYRDYGAAVSLPVGDKGRLNIEYRQVENGLYPYGPYGRYGHDDPWRFDDSGYAFPGRPRPEAAAEYESRLMRPDGPPRLRRDAPELPDRD